MFDGQNARSHRAARGNHGRRSSDRVGSRRQAHDRLVAQVLAQHRRFRVPVGVIGQAWRSGRVQVTLARFLRSHEVELVPLDEQLARSCGELCGATATSDVINASVVLIARQTHDVIVTSDPQDVRRLDPSAPIISI